MLVCEVSGCCKWSAKWMCRQLVRYIYHTLDGNLIWNELESPGMRNTCGMPCHCYECQKRLPHDFVPGWAALCHPANFILNERMKKNPNAVMETSTILRPLMSEDQNKSKGSFLCRKINSIQMFLPSIVRDVNNKLNIESFLVLL